MPELPEVEVVRSGLERLVVGRRIAEVAVTHPRAVRRHVAGAADLSGRLAGARIEAARRRGKFLWLDLSTGEALLAHLGMSGQFLVQPPTAPAEKHLHVRFSFADGGDELRFVDQRTFGGVSVEALVDSGGTTVPVPVAHIARDPLDPAFEVEAFVRALRRRRTQIKRALLDQTLISGIGNIYADEALWLARLHYARATESLRPTDARRLLGGGGRGDDGGPGGRRDVVRQPLRQRQRGRRLLLPFAAGLRARRTRRAGAAGRRSGASRS